VSGGGFTAVGDKWKKRFYLASAFAALFLLTTIFGGGDDSGSSVPKRRMFAYAPDSTHFLSAVCCGAIQAISRDGSQIAYVGHSRGLHALWIRNMGELESRMVPESQNSAGLFFSPDGKWLGFVTGMSTIKKVPLGGGAPVTLADFGGELFAGIAWTDDDRIIFSNGFESRSLWEMSSDGENPALLLAPDPAAGQYGFYGPFSVPGTEYILLSVRVSPPGASPEFEVGVLNLNTKELRLAGRGAHPQFTSSGHLVKWIDGGTVVAQPFDLSTATATGPLEYLASDVFGVVSRGGADFAISWEGTLLYRTGDYEPTLQLVNVDGSVRDMGLPLESVAVNHLDAPRYSPDGTRLSFAVSVDGRHRVFVRNMESGTLMRLTLDGDTENTEWTDAGDSIVMAKNLNHIVIQPADRGGDARTLLSESDFDGLMPGDNRLGSVSVSGPWVAFASHNVEGSDVFALNRDLPGEARELLTTPFVEMAPAISPDGRWLAYVSNETGSFEIYVVPFPDGGAPRSISIGGGDEPSWSRDGRLIYYRNPLGNLIASEIVVSGNDVRVENEIAFSTSDYETSPDGIDYAVHPNGMEFAMIPSRSGGDRFVFVTNAIQGSEEDGR
ncbi:MAG: hypothetical protein OEZ54_11430, partial [Gemmatimonadota bacterium]|nr:hypothetical protein [Gemmatimonadota bacterium]